MLTPEQETFLAALADAGIAEQADIVARNAQIELGLVVSSAREAKLAELKAQAEALVADGMQEFELNTRSSIKV